MCNYLCCRCKCRCYFPRLIISNGNCQCGRDCHKGMSEMSHQHWALPNNVTNAFLIFKRTQQTSSHEALFHFLECMLPSDVLIHYAPCVLDVESVTSLINTLGWWLSLPCITIHTSGVHAACVHCAEMVWGSVKFSPWSQSFLIKIMKWYWMNIEINSFF